MIGDRLVQPGINSIEFEGTSVHLEPKIMQVLLKLAEDPGEVVTREALRSAVWPDVFVGDDVLIRAVTEIRRAFNDDARSPHTVQTVPKVGYRLIAPVKRELPPAPAPEPSLTSPLPPSVPAIAIREEVSPLPIEEKVEPVSPRYPRFASLLIAAIFLAILFGVAGFWLYRSNHPPEVFYTSRPFTTYPGSELRAAFSPDGNTLAFIWRKPEEAYGHIFIKSLNSEEPVRLTSGAEEELSPAWSPDGRNLAFLRHSNTQSSIQIIPALGGSEHEVYVLPVNTAWEYGGLTWSPDGNSLIFPQQSKVGGPSQLVELNLTTRSVHPLTTPPTGWDGDWMPAFSPDGKQLVFVRSSERSVRDLYSLDRKDGSLKQITKDGRLVVGFSWTADGKAIVFSSNRGGSLALWRVSAKGGIPEREHVGNDDAYGPTISLHGNHLAYSHGSATWNMDSLTLGEDRKAAAVSILTSSEQDAAPSVAPSGDRIAFQSWRSGAQEIWVSGVTGSNPVQLTNTGASSGSPSWSPDGKRLAFDARPDGFAHIFIMQANGGNPTALTSGPFNDIVPSWSQDGQWIYFGSNRSGSWQIWKMSSHGGQMQQVTTGGGMVAKESADGRWLYFTSYSEGGLWRRSLQDGSETKISEFPPAGQQNYWTVAPQGLYLLAHDGQQASLIRMDPESHRSTTLFVFEHYPTSFGGMAITPDGKHLLFAELARAESDITLVDNYH